MACVERQKRQAARHRPCLVVGGPALRSIMVKMLRIFIVAAAFCGCLALAGAEDQSPFQVQTLEIGVFDKFNRPYVTPAELTSVGVRLAQGEQQTCKAVFDHEALSSAGVEYPKQSDKFESFPVENGVAKIQFVVFKDAAPGLVDYEVVLYTREKPDGASTKVALNPTIWHVGLNSQTGDVKAEVRAPHSKGELAAMAAFAVLGTITTYVLFGRLYFRRLLFNNRQEVGSALGWSNLAVVLSWTLLFVGVAVLFYFPFVVWSKPTSIYGIVMGGYAAIVSVAFGLATMMTRR